MKPAVLLALVLVLSAAPALSDGGSGRAIPGPVPLDLSGATVVRVPLPVREYYPHHFRMDGRRPGWVVRLDLRRRGAGEETGRPEPPTPAATVAGGRVFVGGDRRAYRVHALEAATGRKLFSVTLDDNGPSTPTVTPRGEVVTCTESCTVYGLDAVTGACRWRNRVGPNVFTPAVPAGRALLLSWRDEEGRFVLGALDAASGDVVWRTKTGREVVQEPVVGLGRVFAALADRRLVCLDLRTGEKRWEADADACGAPVLAGGGLYVPTLRGSAVTVSRVDPLTGKIAWTAERPALLRPDGSTTTARDRRFGLPRGQWGDDPPRPFVLEPFVYLASGSWLVAWDSETGEVRHRFALPEGREFYAPPARIGTRLLYATREGLLVELDPETGEVRKAVDLGVTVTSRPAMADGRVHVTSGDLVWGVPWLED